MSYIEDGGGLERPRRAKVGDDGRLVTLDTVHDRIHTGEFFSAGHFDPALGAAATQDILFSTGAIAPHTEIDGQVGQSVRALLYEDTTVSAAGSPLPGFNRLRTSGKTALSAATLAPTITLVGTVIFSGYINGGSQGQSQGGDLSSFAEYVLKPNSLYLLRLINNLAAGATFAQLGINWYEPGAS